MATKEISTEKSELINKETIGFVGVCPNFPESLQ